MTNYNELEWLCKETVVAKFKSLYRYFSGGTEKIQNSLSWDNWPPGQDLNPGYLDY